MGRNKSMAPLSKAERKRVKNGAPVADNINQRAFRAFRTNGAFRNDDIADTRGHSQTSNNSWVHAVLFVVLAVIVVSWALGY